MFSAVLRLGAVLGYAGFLFLFYRRLLFRKTVWREVFRAIWASPLQLGGRTVYTFVPFLLATVTYFDYAFFAVAVHSIDVSVATVFYEAWPILLIALTGYLFNRERPVREGPAGRCSRSRLWGLLDSRLWRPARLEGC